MRTDGLRFHPPWVALTLLVSGALMLPVIVVAASVFLSSGDIWQHLYDTVLAEYIGNSLLLALGVGCLSLPLGVIPAWLVTMYRFPGSRQLEWALLMPLAMPAYIIAYTYTGMLDVAGPLQSWLRAAFPGSTASTGFPTSAPCPARC